MLNDRKYKFHGPLNHIVAIGKLYRKVGSYMDKYSVFQYILIKLSICELHYSHIHICKREMSIRVLNIRPAENILTLSI